MDKAKEWAILILAFFLGFNFYQDLMLQKEVSVVVRTIEATTNNTVATLSDIECEMDSLHKHIGKLATATVYLDSCQQQKNQKSEKAYRRGRFIGGLVKGLLPF